MSPSREYGMVAIYFKKVKQQWMIETNTFQLNRKSGKDRGNHPSCLQNNMQLSFEKCPWSEDDFFGKRQTARSPERQ